MAVVTCLSCSVVSSNICCVCVCIYIIFVFVIDILLLSGWYNIIERTNGKRNRMYDDD